jgi:hypothetical protein
MSEPTIKPFMVTMERGEDGKVFWREHYTHDDLVAVAMVLLVPFAPAEGLRAAAEAVVERLTGVKR